MLDEIRILLVEDHEDTRALLRDELQQRGYACFTASDVDEAVAALRDRTFALTILDWGLDRSGAEVLRTARDLHPAMPVIVMSGMPVDVRTDAVTQQADAFLQKPVSAAVLASQAAQLLKRVRNTPAPFLPREPQEVKKLEEVKAIYIKSVVELFDGNVSLAARALGVHRQTVSAALKQGAPLPAPAVPIPPRQADFYTAESSQGIGI